MIIKYTQIINSPVIDLKEQKNLGKVLDVILNKTDLSIKAFIVRTTPFWPAKKVVSFSDVIEVASNAVIVNDDNAIIDINDSVRIQEAIADKFVGIHQQVYTKSGQKVGFVCDYVFFGETGEILKIYVKWLFADRIISCASIISVERKKIIIEDDFKLIKGKRALDAETA